MWKNKNHDEELSDREMRGLKKVQRADEADRQSDCETRLECASSDKICVLTHQRCRGIVDCRYLT